MLLTASHIQKQYDGRQILADLSLDVHSGELFVLLGASGCGKTTLLKIIAGLVGPDAGQILINGNDVSEIPPERRNVVYLFQKPTLFNFMNVRENIGFGLKMRAVETGEIRRRVEEALEHIGLAGYGERNTSQLSGGEAQRVALARGLVLEPDLLLLDEPLSSLDASKRDEMRELIRGVNRNSGITMIMVTHDQMEAAVMGDRIGVMIDGSIEAIDTPRALFNRPPGSRVAEFLGQSLFHQFLNITKENDTDIPEHNKRTG